MKVSPSSAYSIFFSSPYAINDAVDFGHSRLAHDNGGLFHIHLWIAISLHTFCNYKIKHRASFTKKQRRKPWALNSHSLFRQLLSLSRRCYRLHTKGMTEIEMRMNVKHNRSLWGSRKLMDSAISWGSKECKWIKIVHETIYFMCCVHNEPINPWEVVQQYPKIMFQDDNSLGSNAALYYHHYPSHHRPYHYYYHQYYLHYYRHFIITLILFFTVIVIFYCCLIFYHFYCYYCCNLYCYKLLLPFFSSVYYYHHCNYYYHYHCHCN